MPCYAMLYYALSASDFLVPCNRESECVPRLLGAKQRRKEQLKRKKVKVKKRKRNGNANANANAYSNSNSYQSDEITA